MIIDYSDISIIAAAVLAATSCSVLGVFLVLRRDALLGDAISHAILPGLAFAYLATQSRDPLPMFIGAAIFGILTAYLAQFISRNCSIDKNASLGIVFTTLFAIGIITIRIAADSIDLDPGCVLYGLLELTPIDTLTIYDTEIPRAIIILGTMLLINLLFVILFYKELVITSFNEHHALAIGINTTLVHYLLMSAVAATSVAAFESVGSILVVALFIVPAATARVLTDRLSLTFAIAIFTAISSSVIGYFIAKSLNSSVAGTITTVSGMILLTAVIFSPTYGLVAKFYKLLKERVRIYCEDILGLLYRLQKEEIPTFSPTPRNIKRALGGGVYYILAIALLRLRKNVRINRRHLYKLTRRGFKEASQIVRSHRLWEAYLAQALALEPDHVHKSATTLEHFTSDQMAEELSAELGGSTTDPHGKKIP